MPRVSSCGRAGRPDVLLGVILLALAGATVAAITIPGGASAFRPPVSQPLRVSVDNSGVAAMGALSGCGVSPTSIPFDGTVHNVTAAPNCLIGITAPPDGFLSRYRFGATKVAYVRTCLAGLCPTADKVVYLELLNSYSFQAVASAPPCPSPGPCGSGYLDPGLRFFVSGQVGRFSGAVVCVVGTMSSMDSVGCLGWSDYGRPVAFPQSPLREQMGSRWVLSGAASFTDTTGGNLHQSVYIRQVRELISYSMAVPAGTGYSPPLLTYASLGSNASGVISMRPASFWVDSGVCIDATNPLQGSGVGERWGTAAPERCPTRGGTVRLTYYHQFFDSFNASVYQWSNPGASSASFPPGASPPQVSVSFRAMGSTVTRSMGTTTCPPPSGSAGVTCAPAGAFSDWVDAGTTVSYPAILAGSSSAERWATSTHTFRNTSPKGFEPTYYHQFLVTFGYSTDDSSTIPAGVVVASYLQLGNGRHYLSSSGVLAAPPVSPSWRSGVAPASAWADAGVGTVRFMTTAPGSGNERWGVGAPVLEVVESSSATPGQAFVHQYALSYAYSLAGGGSPAPPSLTCTSLSVLRTWQLSAATTSNWCDRMGTWNVSPSLLLGSSSSERWTTNQVLGGLVGAPASATFVYFHQYLVTFAYSIQGGGTPAAPSVTFSQFGVPWTMAPDSGSIVAWVDGGSAYLYSDATPGSSLAERWAVPQPSTGTADSSETVDMVYFHQYSVTLGFSTTGGGSPLEPVIANFTAFGLAASQAAASDGSSVAWVDAGETVTYPAAVQVGGFTLSTSTPSFVASSPDTLEPAYS